jgi:signal transduction histidine kinase
VSELPKEIEERVQHMLPRDLLHDLRTPLGAILGYSELMIEQMKERGDEEFIPYLERIRIAGKTLLEMMTDNFQESGPREKPSDSEAANS